ncbi:hypothetical protein [Polycladidibacter stylochi]|uniref:hypothetical protein n=1 Tax=Polycladidibacter stylochi TaxID=1807766 RepID=UPI0008339127|nr:hypothetical protein [Pseudovibrio stylochi]
MTETFATIAAIAGGYAVFKYVQREVRSWNLGLRPVKAKAYYRSFDNPYPQLVLDPRSGKYIVRK